MRRRIIGDWLRRIADRIDYHGAPKSMGIMAFTFERGQGIVFREVGLNYGRGCPMWYLGDDDYKRAHDEAERPI